MNIKDYLIDFYVEQNGHSFTDELAKMIVKDMAVTDGSGKPNGEHWTKEETTAAGESVSVDWSKISKNEWYIVLNMVYSDYYAIEKKYGLPTPNFYVDMALCWFNDVDSTENKTFNYYF